MDQPPTPMLQTKATGHGPHSTPIMQNVSSVHSDCSHCTWSYLNPLITHELKDNVLSTTHCIFLQHALGTHPVQLNQRTLFLNTLEPLEQVQGALKQLHKAKGETERYKPFCSLANFILDQSWEAFPLPTLAIPFYFACNDPKLVQGPKGTSMRKPNVVLTSLDIADILANTSKRNHSQIQWVDIVAPIKFKMGPRKPMETKMVSMQTKSASASQAMSTSAQLPKCKASSSGSDKGPSKKKSHTGRSVWTSSCSIKNHDFNQLSSYMLEILSLTEGTCQHVLGIFVDRMELQLWYYDHAGAI